MSYKIYKGDAVVVEGESPLTITGIAPNTTVASGDYKAVRVDGERESAKVDIPTFKTLSIAVTGVTIAPKTASLVIGATQQLTPTVLPANATNKAVSYASSAAGVATVNASGLVAAVAVGTATITVTTTDGAKADTVVITVTAPVIPVTGVTVTPTALSLEIGETGDVTAAIAPANATDKTISFTTGDTDIASTSTTGGNTRTITAKAVGTTTVTARSANDITAICTVTVTAVPEPEPDPEEGA